MFNGSSNNTLLTFIWSKYKPLKSASDKAFQLFLFEKQDILQFPNLDRISIRYTYFLSTIIHFSVGCRSSSSPNSGKNLKSSSITSGSFRKHKNVPPFLKEAKLVDSHILFPTFITLRGPSPSYPAKFLALQINFTSEATAASRPHLSLLGYSNNLPRYYFQHKSHTTFTKQTPFKPYFLL